MPHGVRNSLAALALCLALAPPAFGAQRGGADTTWTDPPARQSDDPKSRNLKTDDAGTGSNRPAAEAPQAAPAAPPSATPAAGPKGMARASRPARQAARAERSKTPRRERVAARREAPRRRHALAEAPRTRVAAPHVARPRRMVAVAPPAQDGQPYGYRAYGYGPGYGPGYADDRLDRLRSASEAGYIVMHRRSVEFPDGRSLRIYRPYEEGGPF